MAIETINKKQVEQFEYKIVYFPGDEKYVIYKDDMSVRSIHRVPEVFVTSNREEALQCFNSLT